MSQSFPVLKQSLDEALGWMTVDRTLGWDLGWDDSLMRLEFDADAVIPTLRRAEADWRRLIETECTCPFAYVVQLSEPFPDENRFGFEKLGNRDKKVVSAVQRAGGFGMAIVMVRLEQEWSLYKDDAEYKQSRRAQCEVKDPFLEYEDEDFCSPLFLKKVYLKKIVHEEVTLLHHEQHRSLGSTVNVGRVYDTYRREIVDSDTSTIFFPRMALDWGDSNNPIVRRTYERVHLVIWPLECAHLLDTFVDHEGLLRRIKADIESKDGDTAATKLRRLLRFVQKHGAPADDVPNQMLSLAIELYNECTVREVLGAMCSFKSITRHGKALAGLHSEDTLTAFVSAVRSLADGRVTALSDAFLEILRATNQEDLPRVATAMLSLIESSELSSAMRALARAGIVYIARHCDAIHLLLYPNVKRAVELLSAGQMIYRDMVIRACQGAASIDSSRLVDVAPKLLNTERDELTEAVLKAFVDQVVATGDFSDDYGKSVKAVQNIWHWFLDKSPRDEDVLKHLLEAASRNACVQRSPLRILAAVALSVMRPCTNDVDDWASAVEARRSDTYIRAAVQRRIAQLQTVRKPKREWRMPDVSVEGHDELTAFMRGFTSIKRIGGARSGRFESIKAARSYALQVELALQACRRNGHGVGVTVGGRGSGSYVEVRKPARENEERESVYRKLLLELTKLREFIG